MDRSNGRLCGLILRSQLIVILKKGYFEEQASFWRTNVSIEVFRSEYPRYPSIDVSRMRSFQWKSVHIISLFIFFQKIRVKREKMSGHINLELFMNPTPHSAWQVRILFLFVNT